MAAYDVMDGTFVPNITLGPPVVKALRPIRSSFRCPPDDRAPDRFISAFADAGADQLTVHAEACPHLHRTVHLIKEHGIRAGVALNPHTPVSLVEWLLPDVDLVLIMTVNPGFGGQAFIARTMEKVEAVARRVADLGLPRRAGRRRHRRNDLWRVRREQHSRGRFGDFASPTQRLLAELQSRPQSDPGVNFTLRHTIYIDTI